jgi:hypothetical protein
VLPVTSPGTDTASDPTHTAGAITRIGPANKAARAEGSRHHEHKGQGKRLRSGELRALVAHTLTERHGSEFTVTQLSNMLRRSPGAIANAAEKLCEQGAARRTNNRPKTYSGTPEISRT